MLKVNTLEPNPVSPALPVRSAVPHLVSRAGILSTAILLWHASVLANDPHSLPEMVVCESRVRASTEDTTGRDSFLLDVPELRMAPQGIGAQTDLTIQGSTFSGAGLSLGGLALRNPQTEHFHGELPLPGMLFAPPTLLTGLRQSQQSTGHLVGSVDLQFAPASDRGSIEAGFGETNHNWQSIFCQALRELHEDSELGATVFASRENGDGDDPPANGIDRYLAGAHVQHRRGSSQLDLALGYQAKTFGAQGFYGAPAAFPSEETVRDTLLLATWRTGATDEQYTRLSGAWRRMADTYVLDRDRPYLYKNQHESLVTTAGADGRQFVTGHVALRWRLELEEERLDSTYEGTYPSTPLGKHRRARGGFLVMPELQLGSWRAALGLRPLFFENDRPAYLPAAGIEGTPVEGHTVHLSYTETVRQPSYTELNYDSPGSLGNQGLDRQHSATVETGWRHSRESVSLHATAFARWERDAVDWTKTDAAARWVAENLGQVRTRGLDLGFALRLPLNIECGASYTHLHKSVAGTAPYASRYVLDYPEHSLRLVLSWRPREWCELRTVQTLSRYVDNHARNSGRSAVEGTAQLILQAPQFPASCLVVSVHNLWDEDTEPLPGQPPAGRRASASLSWNW